MGISRDSLHKRRLTGGKKPQYHKKRKYDMGRQMAMTKIGPKRVHSVRVRGGNTKFRAMRLDTGNFSWGSEVCTRKTRILEVMYNASNNELVRTKTLVKNAIVQIDATYAPRPTAAFSSSSSSSYSSSSSSDRTSTGAAAKAAAAAAATRQNRSVRHSLLQPRTHALSCRLVLVSQAVPPVVRGALRHHGGQEEEGGW